MNAKVKMPDMKNSFSDGNLNVSSDEKSPVLKSFIL